MRQSALKFTSTSGTEGDIRDVSLPRLAPIRIRLLRIDFDTHSFLLVGNLLEGSNAVRGAVLQAFVAGNHDGSGEEVALRSNGVGVVFPLGERGLVCAERREEERKRAR